MHLRAALVLTLLVATPLAAASAPLPPPGTVWTVFTTVVANVRENYATVKVTTDIANRGPDPEFPFVVRIPDDAFVTGLVIERDGTTYEAQVKSREAARQQYEGWKAQQQTGGLVEKARRTSVYSYLINVAEFTSVRATLTYERYLLADRGVYDLPLEAPVSGFGQDLGARFDVTVRDSAGVTALWGEPAGLGAREEDRHHISYEVGPRPDDAPPTPFTASYTLSPTPDAGNLLTTELDGVGYFAHRFRAPDDAEQLPMDLVLVLDVSGSMAGLKLQQMIDAAKQVVRSLDENDRLHLVAFSSDARASWSGLITMSPENRTRAAREIDALFDGGGTNIEAGLRRGFTALDGIDWAMEEGRFPALVLLTDGQPTAGITGRDDLLALCDQANDHDVSVFGIAFGDDADWGLIRALAADGEGAAIRVPLGAGAEVDLRRFMAALTTPVLRDVHVEYADGVRAFSPGAPVLFAGSELLVVGTYDPARGIKGSVTGHAPEGERRYAFNGGSPAALPFLPRLVAYHEILKLQQDDVQTVARITELALKHSFVTDHTSLVLTLPPQDWREFDATTQQGERVDDDMRQATTPAAPPMTTASNAPASGTRSWPWSVSTADSAPNAPAQRLQLYEDGDANGGTPPSMPTAAPTATSAAVPATGLAVLLVALASVALAMRRRA